MRKPSDLPTASHRGGHSCPGAQYPQPVWLPKVPSGSPCAPPSLFFLPRIERSTDQVIKPVNLEALSKWTGHIPGDVVRDMAQIAPMLARLGYDPYANPPNYGNPDPIVVNNTHRVSACILHSWPAVGVGHGELYCISIFAWATRKLKTSW